VFVAAEFKYEPSHRRAEFLALPTDKFPVVFWGNEGVAKDITRIREYVELSGARRTRRVRRRRALLPARATASR
jgi:hypothetical protein